MRLTVVIALVMARCGALSGRGWWEALGSPRNVAAPMVDQSGLAFRQLVRRHGVDLAYTPMLHAGVIASGDARAKAYLARHFRTAAGDWPLVAQFAGADPDAVETAVGRALEAAGEHVGNVVALDLNLGCPQNIARRGRYGAFLLENDLDAACAVVARLDRTFGSDPALAVTAKIRLLGDDAATAVAARRLVDAGASAVCVHGRTRAMNKQHSGAPSWERIAAARAALPADVPTIANGGVGALADVRACLDATGCDAVMSSEALLENPALFAGNRAGDGSYVSARALAREFVDLAEVSGAHHSDARAHVFKILYGGVMASPRLRERLASAPDLGAVRAVLDDLEAADPGGALECAHASPAFDAAKSWYWRHRAEVPRAAADPAVIAARRARKAARALERSKGRARAA